MWSWLKRHVAELRAAPPGERFAARYRACAARRESRLATVTYVSAGALALLLGILFSFWPVIPGFVFVLAGLALLSARFAWLAHRLDRLELACRRRIPRAWLRRRRKKRAPGVTPGAAPVTVPARPARARRAASGERRSG